jgi:hypothetical protein
MTMSGVDARRWRVGRTGSMLRGSRARARGDWRPGMPSLGIVSLLNRLVIAILAGLGTVAIEWVPPVERLDGSDRI